MPSDKPKHQYPPALRPTGAKHQATRLEDLGAEATKYIQQSKAENTKRAYRADWEDFSA